MLEDPLRQIEDLTCPFRQMVFDPAMKCVERVIASAGRRAHERHDGAEPGCGNSGDDHCHEIRVAVSFARHQRSQLEERNGEKQQHDRQHQEDDPCRRNAHGLSLQRFARRDASDVQRVGRCPRRQLARGQDPLGWYRDRLNEEHTRAAPEVQCLQHRRGAKVFLVLLDVHGRAFAPVE